MGVIRFSNFQFPCLPCGHHSLRCGVLLHATKSSYKPSTVKATAELLVLARRPGSAAGAALGWPTVNP